MSNFVVENFCGGAGQGAEAVVAQHGKIVGQRHAGEFDSVDNLHGGEGVDVHVRGSILHGVKDVAIVKLGEIARQSTLNADFGSAELPGFDGLPSHVAERVEICVRLAGAAAEGAEFAFHEANVGEI